MTHVSICVWSLGVLARCLRLWYCPYGSHSWYSSAGYTSEKSSILVIGLSVHTAPVEIREKLAIPEAEWPRAIDELCSSPHIEEAGVLSTCNRMEIYVVALSWHRGIVEVEHWMSKVSYSSPYQMGRQGSVHLVTPLRAARLNSLSSGRRQRQHFI
jgi:hypothetical protein